jgi:putative DNA primase/helicase
MNNLLDKALPYAARGWHVFPCYHPVAIGCSCKKPDCDNVGKHPRWHAELLPHGGRCATTDPALITRWWRMWPQANVAIATGAVSGIVALDIDPKHGGDASLDDLEATYAPLPETVEAITGSGGRHILFAHTGGHVSNSIGKIADGLDIRGDGGYIVAPPSLHASGRRYEWEILHHPDDTPLPPMPPWLLALIKDAETSPTKCSSAPDGPIPEGARNDTLFRLACAMRRHGAPEAAILAALEVTNKERCNPPLEASEVVRIAGSAGHYEPGQGKTKQGYEDHFLGPRESWCGVPSVTVTRRVVTHE